MSPLSEKPHEKAKRIKGIPPESTSFYSNPKVSTNRPLYMNSENIGANPNSGISSHLLNPELSGKGGKKRKTNRKRRMTKRRKTKRRNLR